MFSDLFFFPQKCPLQPFAEIWFKGQIRAVGLKIIVYSGNIITGIYLHLLKVFVIWLFFCEFLFFLDIEMHPVLFSIFFFFFAFGLNNFCSSISIERGGQGVSHSLIISYTNSFGVPWSLFSCLRLHSDWRHLGNSREPLWYFSNTSKIKCINTWHTDSLPLQKYNCGLLRDAWNNTVT